MRTTSQKVMFSCIQTKGEEKFLDDSRGGLSALWGSWKKLLKVVNFGGVFLRSFLQKIRKILLNAVWTPQESLKNFVLKKLKKKGVKKAKNMLLVFGKVVFFLSFSPLSFSVFSKQKFSEILGELIQHCATFYVFSAKKNCGEISSQSLALSAIFSTSP